MRKFFVVTLVAVVVFFGALEADAYSSREHDDKIRRLREEYNAAPTREREQAVLRAIKEKDRAYQEYQIERIERRRRGWK